MSTDLYLGVDGGQSSTTALIGDANGRVIGHGSGGPCNHVQASEGRPKFIGAMDACLRAACYQAGLDPSAVRFRAACLGFSGGPSDKEDILREILRTGRMFVTDDALIALSGATEGAPGIIVIAGTGSIAFGRNAAGRTARAGGWGYAFGDEGGGFDLTRQALRAALRFEEGWGPATALHRMLLDQTGARDANDLLHRFYTEAYPRSQIAALSKLVDQAASEGDGIAMDLLADAAAALASIAEGVRQQLFPEIADHVAVAPVGGVFRSVRLLGEFRRALEATGRVRVIAPALGPAAGALIEAYRLAGLSVTLSGVPREK